MPIDWRSLLHLLLGLGVIGAFGGGCKEGEARRNDVRDWIGSNSCAPAAFTACVENCDVSGTSHVRIEASCKDGVFHCDGGLVPAVGCPSSSWPSENGRAGCGPWVDGYDCGGGTCGVCTEAGLLTCGPCS